MTTPKTMGRQDYLILEPFRLDGRWMKQAQTIALTPAQATNLLLCGKIRKVTKVEKVEDGK